MNVNLNLLESKLQSLFEDRILSILPGIGAGDRIINKIATAIKQNIVESKETGSAVPNVITLIVAPNLASMWKEPQVMSALKNVIQTAIQEIGLKIDVQPVITIAIDETLPENEVSVLASHKIESMEDTKGMATNNKNEKESGAFPENAFLIVEGVKVYPLKEPVVNIGRRLENQLVIDDPRISRNHAQLRAINGRFVLFDLNSTGGSFVNGQRTSQTVLYPGDVISLAGVSLIFGQDTPPPRPDLNDTSPFKDSEQKDRPTATLDQNTVDLQTDRLTRDKKSRRK